MVKVYVGLGSNINKEINFPKAIDYFISTYSDVICSPIYECPAIGFAGDSFYNMVIGFETEQTIKALKKQFIRQELLISDLDLRKKFESRAIDIDLLLYGDEIHHGKKNSIPRDDILKYAFVLKPLSDIAPNELHPILKISYSKLWWNFNKELQELVEVENGSLLWR